MSLRGQLPHRLLQLRDQAARTDGLTLQGLHLPGVFQHRRFLLLDLQHTDVLTAFQPSQALQRFVGDTDLILAGRHFRFDLRQFALRDRQLLTCALPLCLQLQLLRHLRGHQACLPLVQLLFQRDLRIA